MVSDMTASDWKGLIAGGSVSSSDAARMQSEGGWKALSISEGKARASNPLYDVFAYTDVKGRQRFLSRKREETAAEKKVRKLYEPVTIYGDDSPEIAAAKMAVAQKRQAQITAGGFIAEKAIQEDSPMQIVDSLKEQYSEFKSSLNVGQGLKLLGVGAGGALLGASAALLLQKMNKKGGSNMGIGVTYQAVDDFFGGYLPGGITPGQNTLIEQRGGVVRRYSNGLMRFNTGHMGIIGKDGMLKTWKPYRPIVIGKRPTIGQLSRVVKRAKVWQKGLNKLLR